MVATTKNLKGAYKPTASALGLLPLNEAMDSVKGNTATKLTRPENCTILVLKADVGDWLLKPGDYAAGLTDTDATTTGGTAGNSAWKLEELAILPIAAPNEITVKGTDANSILKYYWI